MLRAYAFGVDSCYGTTGLRRTRLVPAGRWAAWQALIGDHYVLAYKITMILPPSDRPPRAETVQSSGCA